MLWRCLGIDELADIREKHHIADCGCNRIQRAETHYPFYHFENGVDGAGSVIASYDDKQAEIIYSKITDSKLPTQIQGENGCMIIEQCPIIKKITIYYRNGETEELQFDKRDNPMIYETKDFIRLIKEHKVDHQFLRASEIEMDITDEVRRQTGIVFPADKIREQ